MRNALGPLAFALLLGLLGTGVIHVQPTDRGTPSASSTSPAASGGAPLPTAATGRSRVDRASVDSSVAPADTLQTATRPTAPAAEADDAWFDDERLALADAPPPAGPALRRMIEETLAELDADETRDAPVVVPAVVDQLVDTGAVRIVFSTAPPTTPVAPGFEAAELALRAFGGVRPDASLVAAGPSLRVFPAFGHAAARVDARGFLDLLASGATDRIELDAVHRPSLATSIAIIDADIAHLAGADGAGHAVAVLDTGVDLDHPMFSGRVIDEACFSLLSDCPNDSWQMIGPGAGVPCDASGCGHGSLVAGIAVGRQPDDSLVGVAPAASLISIQIFSDLGSSGIGAYSSDILSALQHVHTLTGTHTIASVNLSLGGDLYESAADCDAAGGSQLAAVDALRSAGVTVVAASGNEGRIDAMTTPGCLSNVVGVAATRDDDSIASFSNVSQALSVFAPGQSIETSNSIGGTSFASGTSMATPHVAGAIAAIREVHPTATVAEIENALTLTGEPIFDARNGITRPRIDVDDAIALLTTNAATPPPPAPAPVVGSGSGSGGAASPAGGGGGSACGLLGLEPFLAVGVVRLLRRRRPISLGARSV